MNHELLQGRQGTNLLRQLLQLVSGQVEDLEGSKRGARDKVGQILDRISVTIEVFEQDKCCQAGRENRYVVRSDVQNAKIRQVG